jgi:putative membrane protein
MTVKPWGWFITFALTLSVTCALGHGNTDRPATHNDLWRAWEFDPLVVLGLAVSGVVYAIGLRRLWKTTRVGSGLRRWQAGAFALGWFAAVVALISPLHPMGRVLFSAHMTQHEILMLVTAPLMVLGRPMVVFLWAFSNQTARKLAACTKARAWQKTWHAISNPFSAWLIHLFALWIWHVPSLFEATIENDFIHALQHISFLFSALLFWWAVLHGRHKVLGYGMAVLYMFTTALHSGILGALLTFTTILCYPSYAQTPTSWGLTPLEDQQLGGLIMWIPAGLVYIVAALILFAGWLQESETRTTQNELASAQR